MNDLPVSLTFDDVLLVPKHSEIEHRATVNIGNLLGRNIDCKIPIISSPMDSVTEDKMALKMQEYGGVGIIHRRCTIEAQCAMVLAACSKINPGNETTYGAIGAAIGSTGDYLERAKALISAGAKIICVDVAHGDHLLIKRALESLNSLPNRGDFHIMAGNVATGSAFCNLAAWGADSIRVGIGGGCGISGTRILMADSSYKNIEDIEAGDEIIGGNGKVVKVKGLIDSGLKKVKYYKHVGFYKKSGFTADHNHYVLESDDIKKTTLSAAERKIGNKAIKYYNKEDMQWKRLDELSTDSSLLTPSNIDFKLQNSFEIKLEDGSLVSSEKFPEEIGYIIGTFIRNGRAVMATSTTRWKFSKQQNSTAEKLVSYLKTIGVREVGKDTTGDMLSVTFKDSCLALFLNQIGAEKETPLPIHLMYKNQMYLKALLDGLVDTNDHSIANLIYCGNTNANLIELFGVLFYIIYGTFPYYTGRNSTFTAVRPWNFIKKNENTSHSLVKLTDIASESSDEVQVWDIEVDDECHSFIANNVIVHNSICSTRLNTGFGVPNLSAIIDCNTVWEKYASSWLSRLFRFLKTGSLAQPTKPSLIIDGGIRNGGDVVKALAAGADFVMCGSLFAGTDEAPGEIILDNHGGKFKTYRGMASRESQVDFSGTSSAPEGISTTIKYKGPVDQIIKDLIGNVKSGLSYCGASDISQLRQNATFIRQSNAGINESFTHILKTV